MTIGKRIQELREGAGLTQEKLAKELHISRSALGLYETGKRQVSSDLILKIAKYFDVRTDYLFGLED